MIPTTTLRCNRVLPHPPFGPTSQSFQSPINQPTLPTTPAKKCVTWVTKRSPAPTTILTKLCGKVSAAATHNRPWRLQFYFVIVYNGLLLLILLILLCVLVLELTACHESNLLKSKEYKENKYRDITSHLLPSLAHVPVLVFTMEVSVLGIVSNTKPFTQAANLPDIPQSIGHLYVDNHKLL